MKFFLQDKETLLSERKCLIWEFKARIWKNYYHIWNQHSLFYQSAKFYAKQHVGPKMPYLGFLDYNFEKLLSYLKSKPLKPKVPGWNKKTLKLRPNHLIWRFRILVLQKILYLYSAPSNLSTINFWPTQRNLQKGLGFAFPETLGAGPDPDLLYKLCLFKISLHLNNTLKVRLSSFKNVFYLIQWKPFKSHEKYFLFHFKSSFCSQDIYIFVLTFCSYRKNDLIRNIRLTSEFMTSQNYNMHIAQYLTK